MKVLDGNCMVGPWGQRQPEGYTTVDGLLEKMNYLKIDEALVFHSIAKHFQPAVGNEELLELLDGHEQLHPCWVVLPHHTGEFDPPDRLLRKMADKGVRVARICPAGHELELREWCVGELLSAPAEQRVPLIVDFDNLHWGAPIDWDGLVWALAAHPDLPVIVTRFSLASDRRLYPLAERHPNLYVDTSYYQVHRGIEEFSRRFGSRRLIFGTGMPVFDPGLPLAGLHYAGVTEAERAQIAGRNLRTLMEGAHS